MPHIEAVLAGKPSEPFVLEKPPSEQNPVETNQQLTGARVELSSACISQPTVLRQAFNSLRQNGICGFNEWTRAPDIFIPQLTDLWRRKTLPFDRLISFYPFKEIEQLGQHTEQVIVLKALVHTNAKG